MAAMRVASRNGKTAVSWANSSIGLMADFWPERMAATRVGSRAGQTAAKNQPLWGTASVPAEVNRPRTHLSLPEPVEDVEGPLPEGRADDAQLLEEVRDAPRPDNVASCRTQSVDEVRFHEAREVGHEDAGEAVPGSQTLSNAASGAPRSW